MENDQNLIEEIGDAIINLREERQNILTEAALKHDLQERMEDLTRLLAACRDGLVTLSHLH